jgi:hypothetical protein
MRILWCAPVDPQIREARGRSAPGEMTQKEYRSAVIAVSKSVRPGSLMALNILSFLKASS